MALAGLVLISNIRNQNSKDLHRLQYVILFSGLFLLLVLLTEGVTEASLHRALRPDDAIARDGEWVPYLLMVAARGTAFLSVISFVLVIIITDIFDKTELTLAFLVLALIACINLPMQASTLAFISGCLAFLMTYYWPKLFLLLLIIGIVLYALLAPFLATSLLTIESLTQLDINLPRNLQQRLAIWEYTGHLIQIHPILGYGFDASRYLGAEGILIKGTNWPALPLHPHNGILQIWLELGLIGIIAAGIVWTAIWRSLWAYVDQPREVAMRTATFVAFMTLGLISYGIWQQWWVALWGLTAATLEITKAKNNKT